MLDIARMRQVRKECDDRPVRFAKRIVELEQEITGLEKAMEELEEELDEALGELELLEH